MIKTIILLIIFFNTKIVFAQFIDNFDKDEIEGWFYFTGDGETSMDFTQMDGFARISVDATKDKHNVWWAIIKRDVTKYLDLDKLKDPKYQIRVEAKIKLSHAPRRVNFMVNTNKTQDFHKDLMEYDIPDTSNWHIISMTTKAFDALPGDTVYVQFDLTDLGWDKYFADIDYYRADIVDINLAGPDIGELVPYHPPIPEVNYFSNHLNAIHDVTINSDFPDINFNNWFAENDNKTIKLLTINGNQWALLRWDFSKYKNIKPEEAGVFELTTYSASMGGNYSEVYGEDLGMEFGKIRVIEIIGGNPEWNQDEVTYGNFFNGKNYAELFNTQMIYDAEISKEKDGKNFITISRPVLERLFSGKTKGLLIRSLGAVDVSFYSSENDIEKVPKIYFNVPEK